MKNDHNVMNFTREYIILVPGLSLIKREMAHNVILETIFKHFFPTIFLNFANTTSKDTRKDNRREES